MKRLTSWIPFSSHPLNSSYIHTSQLNSLNLSILLKSNMNGLAFWAILRLLILWLDHFLGALTTRRSQASSRINISRVDFQVMEWLELIVVLRFLWIWSYQESRTRNGNLRIGFLFVIWLLFREKRWKLEIWGLGRGGEQSRESKKAVVYRVYRLCERSTLSLFRKCGTNHPLLTAFERMVGSEETKARKGEKEKERAGNKDSEFKTWLSLKRSFERPEYPKLSLMMRRVLSDLKRV